eukprot:gene10249-11951_t
MPPPSPMMECDIRLLESFCDALWESIYVDGNYFDKEGVPDKQLFVQLFQQMVGSIDSDEMRKYITEYVDVIKDLNDWVKLHFASILNYYKLYISVLKSSSFEPAPLTAARPKTKKSGNLSKDATVHLKKWLVNHLHNPYPVQDEKEELSRLTGLTIQQVSNWFINARRRNLDKLRKKHNRVIGCRQLVLAIHTDFGVAIAIVYK